MSVVTRKLGTDYFEVFCKGSPEMIMSLSKPETGTFILENSYTSFFFFNNFTVPQNLMKILKTYTEQGYRVIALGSRVLQEKFVKLAKMHRDEIERDLSFEGLIILENQLKPETAGVIETLKKANIKVVMITGNF